MSLFPIFLKLAARPCVVVGAGNIAESKIESLLTAEASVTVIAPEALPRVRAWAECGGVAVGAAGVSRGGFGGGVSGGRGDGYECGESGGVCGG